jgi:hypothetical protein
MRLSVLFCLVVACLAVACLPKASDDNNFAGAYDVCKSASSSNKIGGWASMSKWTTKVNKVSEDPFLGLFSNLHHSCLKR